MLQVLYEDMEWEFIDLGMEPVLIDMSVPIHATVEGIAEGGSDDKVETDNGKDSSSKTTTNKTSTSAKPSSSSSGGGGSSVAVNKSKDKDKNKEKEETTTSRPARGAPVFYG